MTAFTQSELADLLVRVEGATPGPWGQTSPSPTSIRSSHTKENGWTSEYVAVVEEHNYRTDRVVEHAPNVALIAAAPRLLATVQAQQEEIGEHRLALRRVRTFLSQLNGDVSLEVWKAMYDPMHEIDELIAKYEARA